MQPVILVLPVPQGIRESKVLRATRVRRVQPAPQERPASRVRRVQRARQAKPVHRVRRVLKVRPVTPVRRDQLA